MESTANRNTNSLIGECFPVIFEGIGGYPFVILAGTAALALVFTWFKVTETMGRSLEDITKEFISLLYSNM